MYHILVCSWFRFDTANEKLHCGQCIGLANEKHIVMCLTNWSDRRDFFYTVVFSFLYKNVADENKKLFMNWMGLNVVAKLDKMMKLD